MSEPTPLLPPVKPRQTAPRLWRDGQFAEDNWVVVPDDQPLPIDRRALVSLNRWRAEQSTFVAAGAPIGLKLDVGQIIDFVADDVGRLNVIALPFPKFSDGRSYSTARRLREAGYKGEVRAVGDVLIDQLPLMLRSGFDAFEIAHAATIRHLEERGVPSVTRVYQSGSDVARSNWRSRRQA